MSGQIGLDPASMQLVDGIDAQINQVFNNLAAVASAAGGSLADVVKLNVFLIDLGAFPQGQRNHGAVFRRSPTPRAPPSASQPAPRRAGRGRCRDGRRINSKVESGLAVFLSRQPGAHDQARQAGPHPRRRSGLAHPAALGRRNPAGRRSAICCRETPGSSTGHGDGSRHRLSCRARMLTLSVRDTDGGDTRHLASCIFIPVTPSCFSRARLSVRR